MPDIQVATEALTLASALVVKGGLDVTAGNNTIQGSSGACDGTPAAVAYMMFVDTIGPAYQTMDQAAGDLSRSLNLAAAAYELADGAAAKSLEVKRG